jgi:hypothetical protein
MLGNVAVFLGVGMTVPLDVVLAAAGVRGVGGSLSL